MRLSKEQKDEIRQIYLMPQSEMASLWRFAPTGHKWFDNTLPYSRHFNRRFKQLGGFTPEISKSIGWEG